MNVEGDSETEIENAEGKCNEVHDNETESESASNTEIESETERVRVRLQLRLGLRVKRRPRVARAVAESGNPREGESEI